MSDTGGVLLGRVELEQAFTALGERLLRRGVVADAFVVGGTRLRRRSRDARCATSTPYSCRME